MKILGAILAGGLSRRFGSDKALALLDGRPLISHVFTKLAPLVDRVVCCGRPFADLAFVPDRPELGLGPLGGLNAALHASLEGGFDAVLSVACDVPLLPHDLLEQLRVGGTAHVADLPVIGLWPTHLAPVLDEFVRSDPRRSMLGWAKQVDSVPIVLRRPLANLNRPDDLMRLQDVLRTEERPAKPSWSPNGSI